MSEEFIDRRRNDDWKHKENGAKLDKILENQAAHRAETAVMRNQLDDIAGTAHKPGRMKDLEDRVDDLEDSETALKTLRWIFGAVLAFFGFERISHWMTGK